MTDTTKVMSTHLHRLAYVYVRQSTVMQIQRNPESTDRQYGLLGRATELGWPREQIVVIDEDLGLTGSGTAERSGFDRMAAEVGLGRVGIILALEVSRFARNNADWYRLLDLCGITDTLIGDNDGLYHPNHFNDRLVLGLKGTMSEAELHVLRARLDGGIRNKAARGELRRGLPVGFVWGEADGDVCFDPDEAVTNAVGSVFERFAEMGSARQVWLWFRSEDLAFPTRANMRAPIRWATPTYTHIHHILTNPVYAGAYVYGKTRQERYVDESGNVKKRLRHLPRSEWGVLLTEHHKGFIDWATYEKNQKRLASNTRPGRHEAGGAVREGAALLQGLATCGQCGRRLRVYYQGNNSTPGYHCPGHTLANGRAHYCMRVGGLRIDDAVAKVFLDAVAPAGIEAALQAEANIEADHDAALKQWQLQVERARYEAERAERQFKAVEPENRLVARGLETEWEKRLRDLASAEAELARREQQRPHTLTLEQRETIATLGNDLARVWSATTTTDRDRKELLNTLIEEVIITVDRTEHKAHLTLRWRGGQVNEVDVNLRRCKQAHNRTDEDTIDLLRRLARHYNDATIAGVLNRQGRRTSTGLRFNANRVNNLRQHWNIPRAQPPEKSPEGDLVNIREAAKILDLSPSTLHRWLNEGIIVGEQLTPGAPWRIRITDELRAQVVEDVPEGYVTVFQAMKILGVSRQTVWQRVKRGELQAVHVRRGKRKGLRIRVLDQQPPLFDNV
jgi:DNA invertase Pin-like site-specific DNA recombinase